MCCFLTIAFDEAYLADARVLLESACRLRRVREPNRLSVFSDGVTAWDLHVQGNCSCGLYIAPGTGGDQSIQESPIDDRAEHYRTRGWSETKIERALSQARQRRKRTSPRAIEAFDGIHPSLRVPLCRLATQTGRLLLYAREFAGRLDRERPAVRLRVTYRVDQSTQWMDTVEPEHLIELTAGSRKLTST
jgi:hypothetical protein